MSASVCHTETTELTQTKPPAKSNRTDDPRLSFAPLPKASPSLTIPRRAPRGLPKPILLSCIHRFGRERVPVDGTTLSLGSLGNLHTSLPGKARSHSSHPRARPSCRQNPSINRTSEARVCAVQRPSTLASVPRGAAADLA